MKLHMIDSYEEAVSVIEEIGILPLASIIPNHPSLEELTPKEHWHTGDKSDPWLWRVRFPAEGTAAYGKFFKNKGILLSRKVYPLVKPILGGEQSLSRRYEAGTVSRAAMQLYAIIEAEEGIDTRCLRAKANMQEKEQKRAFEQALLELQGSMDIVISGVKERVNASGEKSGWSSTSFETAAHWTRNAGWKVPAYSMAEAKERLQAILAKSCSAEAMNFFKRIFGF